MRKANMGLAEIIESIKNMKGELVNMEVNRGRKRIERYVGIVESVYPSVFTIDIQSPENKGKKSYSYTDVLCGDVILKLILSTIKEEEEVSNA